MKKSVDGWVIEEGSGNITFYTRLPNHITTANAYHIYRGVLTYKNKETKKGTKKQ